MNYLLRIVPQNSHTRPSDTRLERKNTCKSGYKPRRTACYLPDTRQGGGISLKKDKRKFNLYYGIPVFTCKLTTMKKEKIPNEIKTDSLLRSMSSNYIRLISDADRKARIMIVVNSILLTISVTVLTKTIHHGPPTWISLMLLIVSNLLSLFFTFVSIKPEIHVSIGKDTEYDILHYKKCSEYSFKEYMAHMMSTLNNNDKKLEAVIKELHYFGNQLTRQYRLLKISNNCFYWGIVLSVIFYLLILLLYPGVKENIHVL